MRKNRIIGIAISLLTALTMLAVPASAYLEEVSGASSYLESDSGAWMIRLTGADKDYITDISKIEMYISLKGDAAAYSADMENGVGDFAGFIGLGAAIEGENVSNGFWQQFGFSGILKKMQAEEIRQRSRSLVTRHIFSPAILPDLRFLLPQAMRRSRSKTGATSPKHTVLRLMSSSFTDRTVLLHSVQTAREI